MITSRQVRAARALLGWTQELLADKALGRADRVEAARVRSALGAGRDSRSRAALVAAGIVLLHPAAEREDKKADEEA